ncbi:phenazine biosynthesis-like domain-containing [Chlorella sorokiniana]|uniref:Phenazine biosynthesis-like domain-containing n=1 Tax=Chlorella sorokiniana TaxID=3076 RepID=A0A2P6TXY4_CHLSO|nr:phenazine biosynthesis-like domain-containing [Chlorella sorokiniana]|eukprot:PRW58925.1 phenazine biosynthesis-like domain-containing [Chlorella sorokiniana]
MTSSARSLQFYQIDAFTAAAFGGNPAAVVLLPPSALPLSDDTRQKIAAEMNLSETAYLETTDGSSDFSTCTRFRLRWFTPAIEVPLCGHATLASAAALFFGQRNPARQLAFDTLSGELVVKRQAAGAGDGGEGGAAAELLSMDLPLIQATAEAVPPGMDAVVQASVGDLPLDALLYDSQLRYLLIVLRDEGPATREAFLSLQPNNAQLGAAHTGGQLVGVIVSMAGDGSPHDFLSRFFAPWAGIEEDPATGSAHAVLGPYWAQRLGKQRMAARQCSKRGAELLVEVRAEEGRVVVSGSAVTVLQGQLLLPAGA